MKLFIGLLFALSVALFTIFSKGCGDYGNRLESDLQKNIDTKVSEVAGITRGTVEPKVTHYDTILTGKVGSEEEKRAVAKLFANVPAGGGRIDNNLEVGWLGPVISTIEFVKVGPGKVDEAALGGALGAAGGDPFDEATLPSLAEKLRALPGVDDAILTSEPDGDDRKLIVSITPTPPPITAVDIVAAGEGEIDRAAVVGALGIKAGDAYIPAALGPAGQKIAALPGITAAEVTGEEDGDGIKVIAKVTPVKPTPMVISGIKVIPADGASLDGIDVAGAIGVKPGSAYNPGIPKEVEGKLRALDGVEKAAIRVEKTPDGYELLATVTPVKPPPNVVSAFEIVRVGEGEIDKEAALKGAGVAVGDVYDSALLQTVAKKLKGLDGIADATVTAEGSDKGYLLMAKVTPEKPKPRIAGFDFEAPDGFAFDRASALKAAGVSSGDVYDASQLEAIAEKLKALDGIADAKVTAEEADGKYRLIAKLTPEKPKPPSIASFDFEAPDGFAFDRAAALKAAGVSPGDAYDATQLGAIAEKLKALDGIADAKVTAEEADGKYRLVAKLTPEKPKPPSIASFDFEAPDGFAFDRDAALKAAGVSPGDAYDATQLGAIAEKLEALDGIADAKVTAEEADGGGYRLVAKLTPDPKMILQDALTDINVYFDTGSTEVDDEEMKMLVRAAGAIASAGNDIPISVTGFADPRGNLAANQALSLRRAKTVCDLLVSNGVKRDILSPGGGGVPGTENLQKQRRVEVRVAK